MIDDKHSEVLNLLMPELLSREELIKLLQYRCCRMQNLASLSKERLVGLFRQLILPLPQRLNRANRRGKSLTARREKSSLESSAGRGAEDSRSCRPREAERNGVGKRPRPELRPMPNKVRVRSPVERDGSRKSSGDKAREEDVGEEAEPEVLPGKKVLLKRTSSNLDANEGGKRISLTAANLNPRKGKESRISSEKPQREHQHS